MDPIKQLYDNLVAWKYLGSDVQFETFKSKLADPESQSKFYDQLSGINTGIEYGAAGIAKDEFLEKYFPKKKDGTTPSLDGLSGRSQTSVPAQNVGTPSEADPFFPVFDQPAGTDVAKADQSIGLGNLPADMIPGSAPRDNTAMAPVLDSGPVQEYAITGYEEPSTYATSRPQGNRVSEKYQRSLELFGTPMSETAKGTESVLTYAEDARRQADIADTQLSMAFGPDWRSNPDAQKDPLFAKHRAAVLALTKARDSYNAITGAYDLDGTENPIEFGESRRSNLPGYQYKQNYDSKTASRQEKRQIENIREYGSAANAQQRFADEYLKLTYGQDWNDRLYEASQLGLEGLDETKRAEIEAIASDPMFDRWKKSLAAQESGYQAFKQKLESSPNFQKDLAAAASAKRSADMADAIYDSPELLAFLKQTTPTGQVADLTGNWVFRKGAQLVGSLLSLPRTVGQAASSLTGSGDTDSWTVADELGSWADDIVAQAEIEYPKPEALNRPLYERVAKFEGLEVVVDAKGKPIEVRGGEEPEGFMDRFEAAGVKPEVKFNGAKATTDKVLDAVADLMLYRIIGGGTKPGVAAASFFMSHQSAYNDAIQQQKMAPEEAAQFAFVTSSLQGALEAYVGDIETRLGKRAFQEALTLGRKEAAAAAGNLTAAQRAVIAMKPVIKEVVGENKEEFMQSVQDGAVRAAYNNATGANLDIALDKESMKETALVTTLLTAPMAALGMGGAVDSYRRAALRAAVSNPQKFAQIAEDLVKEGAITREQANKRIAAISRLSAMDRNISSTVQQEARDHIIAMQEHRDNMEAQAEREDILPVQAKAAKEEVKAADEAISSLLQETESAGAPETIFPTADDSSAPIRLPQAEVSEFLPNPAETPEQATARAESQANDIAAGIAEILDEKGIAVPDSVFAEAETFVADHLTNPQMVVDPTAPASQVLEAAVDDFIQEKGLESPAPIEKTPLDTFNKFISDGGKVSIKDRPRAMRSAIFSESGDSVVDIASRIASAHGISVPEAESIIRNAISSPEGVAPGRYFGRRAAFESGVPMEVAVAAEAAMPDIMTAVENAGLSEEDVAAAEEFASEVTPEMVLAVVDGIPTEMTNEKFEQLRKKNPAVHKLIFDTINEEVPEPAGPVTGDKRNSRQSKARKTPATNAGTEAPRPQGATPSGPASIQAGSESDPVNNKESLIARVQGLRREAVNRLMKLGSANFKWYVKSESKELIELPTMEEFVAEALNDKSYAHLWPTKAGQANYARSMYGVLQHSNNVRIGNLVDAYLDAKEKGNNPAFVEALEAALATEIAPTKPTTNGAIAAATSGAVTVKEAAQSMAGDPVAGEKVVASAAAIEADADELFEIENEIDAIDKALIEEKASNISPSVLVTRGDKVIVAKYDGLEDVLRSMGGVFMPGKGWAFPLSRKPEVARAISKSRLESRKDRARRSTQAHGGMVSAAMADPGAIKAEQSMAMAIADAETTEERVEAVKEQLKIAETERVEKVKRVTERLKAAFPNIEVVTDPGAIAEALNDMGETRPVAGFAWKGKVYINLETAGADAPIHEFGHIWAAVLKDKNKKLYDQGVSAIEGSEYHQAVLEDPRYSDLEPDEIIDEAIALAIGERGARLTDDAKWSSFKPVLDGIRKLANKLFGPNTLKMSAKQFADFAAAKMLSGEVLMEETSADIEKIESGAKFLFAGEKGAERSDMAMRDLEAAKRLEKMGHTSRTIWAATNWYRGADGLWRFEVSDKLARVNVAIGALPEEGQISMLGDIMSHEHLYGIYPEMKNIPVVMVPLDAETNAMLSEHKDSGALVVIVNTKNVTSDDMLMSALLHEIQHVAQNIEGFATAFIMDPEEGSRLILDNLKDAVDQNNVSRVKAMMDLAGKSLRDLYYRSAGEVEARNVQERQGGEGGFPVSTEDVAPAEQIVLFDKEASTTILPTFDGLKLPAKAKFQYAANTIRDEAIRKAAMELVKIEIKDGSEVDAAADVISAGLGIDKAEVLKMFSDEASRNAAKSRWVRLTEPGSTIASFRDAMVKKYKRWLSPTKNLPRPIFKAVQKMERSISASMYRAEKVAQDLEKVLKGHDPEVRKLVQEVLEGSVATNLPPDVAEVTMAMRAEIDNLSRQLLLSGAVKKGTIVTVLGNMGIEMDAIDEAEVSEIEDILSKPPSERNEDENLIVDDFLSQHSGTFGTYLNRQYRAHVYPDWADRVSPDVVDRAKRFIISELKQEYDDLVTKLSETKDKLAKTRDNAKKKLDDAISVVKMTADLLEAAADAADPASAVSLYEAAKSVRDEMEIITGISDGQAKMIEDSGVSEELATALRIARKAKATMDRAEEAMAKSDEKIGARLDEVSARLSNVNDEINAILYRQNVGEGGSGVNLAGEKNLSIFMRRKNVSGPIRDLLGEFRDPEVNFMVSVNKMVNLLHAQEFLNDMVKKYSGVYFFQDHNKPEGNYAKVSAEGRPYLAPLDGWWTTPDIVEALADMREPDVMHDVERMFVTQIVQRVKLGKTILSPITHARNFWGNTAFVLLNGWNPVRMYQAWKELAPRFNEGSSAEWRKYAERLHELGVFGESVSAGDLDALRKYSGLKMGPDEVANSSRFTERYLLSPFKAAVSKAKFVYELEDNFYRMMAFESEKSRYAKAIYGKPFADLSADERSDIESRAAGIVSHVLPTYSYVPKLVQLVRRLPIIGTFVAFPAEMVRVSYNNVQLGIQELRDRRTAAIGIRRLVGASIIHASEYAAIAAAMGAFGYSDDEWKDAELFVAPFEKNGALIPLPKDNKGFMGYVNMSYTNPYGFIPKMIRAFQNDESGVAGGAAAALGQFVEPYLSPDLTFDTFNQLFLNVDDWGRPIRSELFEDETFGTHWLAKENVSRQMAFMAKKLQPGILKSARDAWDVYDQNASLSGKVKTWQNFTLAHLMGLSIQRIDPTVSYRNQMYKLAMEKGEARRLFTAVQKQLSVTYKAIEDTASPETLRRKDAEAEEKLNAAYETAQKEYVEVLNEAHKIAMALMRLGYTRNEALKEIQGSWTNAEKSAIISGQTNIPLTFTKKGRY